jgi:hypothetical protein
VPRSAPWSRVVRQPYGRPAIGDYGQKSEDAGDYLRHFDRMSRRYQTWLLLASTRQAERLKGFLELHKLRDVALLAASSREAAHICSGSTEIAARFGAAVAKANGQMAYSA